MWIWVPLFIWSGFVLFFHISELFLCYWFHGSPKTSWRSTLVSAPYVFTLALAILEFCLEAVFWPDSKGIFPIVLVGALLMAFGELIRKVAIFTAGRSFTHDIATKKTEGHRLVKEGIFKVCRHPSYLGWFIWIIGGQILLTNPVCFVALTSLTWFFFNHRIAYEEHFLREIFPDEYEQFSRDVPWSGIPFAPTHPFEGKGVGD
mmetsp:Transcript_50/g.107  ORF Transcript_50/g.107 Transcript_50/m.107 type:complete len:204 (-) Transcript_50:1324-1935(-)